MRIDKNCWKTSISQILYGDRHVSFPGFEDNLGIFRRQGSNATSGYLRLSQ